MREGFATQDTVVVQGAGPVGVMAAFRAKAMGAGKVIMVGAPKHRLELARNFGVDETIDIDEVKEPKDRQQEVKTLTGSIGADLVIECAGAPQAVPEGIDMCRIGGTYILIGCHADRGTVGVNPSRIVQKELRLLGQNYASPQQYGRDLKILAAFADKYPFKKLVTHRFPIDEAEKAFQVQRNLESMKVALTHS
jgi:threonine dehydrogenase-like Zn-dependent dehydrogenase